MIGVKGTATIHMSTSEIAKFNMKKLVTECMFDLRTTTIEPEKRIRKLKSFSYYLILIVVLNYKRLKRVYRFNGPNYNNSKFANVNMLRICS